MKSEKSNQKLINPNGLQADLAFNTEKHEIALEADILDISCRGIRVRLKEPIAADMVGNVRINMMLPESHSPFCVHGILKHQPPGDEGELHCIDRIHGSIDDLMFECVELDETTVFIKTH